MTDGTGTDHDTDILIIGAGISGIDAAYHLQKNRPGTRFAILEAEDRIGGTWHTHRFPGIRSDSDLFTFGFQWKPWRGVPIATGDEILAYLNEAIAEQDLQRHMRFGMKVRRAHWSEDDRRWRLEIDTPDGPQVWTCGFLWMCCGYYRHDQGYVPDYPGRDDFAGPVIHPQTWPEDLDHAGKRIVVIGSGATAATLIPALAKDAAHVTMLQRSPTFYFPRPPSDDFTDTLNALDLPADWHHEIMRRKFLHDQQVVQRRAREEPEALAADLMAAARAYLGPDYDVETHFTPHYRVWNQRVALIPDGDLFRAIRAGRASVVTDHIDRFVAQGIRLQSGAVLEADIIVSATGLNLNALGGIAFDVDGRPFDLSASVTHRGIMFSGLPNLVHVFGYLRSSWTLRADLVSDYVCRLLDHMDRVGAASVRPEPRSGDLPDTRRPFVDPENFDPGYFRRALHLLPQQGKADPWVMSQDYFIDRDLLPSARFDDGSLVFTPADARTRAAE